MMTAEKLLPFVAAFGWLVTKYLTTIWFPWETSAQLGTFVHLFAILGLAVWVAQHQNIGGKANEQPFLDALISVLRVTFRYVLLGTLAVGAWYFAINSKGLEARKAEQATRIQEAFGSDEAFEQTLEVAPELFGGDREVMLQNQLETLEMYYSAPFHLGFALLGLAVAGLAFSLFVTWIWRLIWRP